MQKHAWTAKQESFIRNNYAFMNCHELADSLGLKAKQVKAKICRMSLKKPPKPVYEQATKWVERLSDIVEHGIKLVENGCHVECRSKFIGQTEFMAYYVATKGV